MKKFTKEQERIYNRIKFTLYNDLAQYSGYEEVPFDMCDVIVELVFEMIDIFLDTPESKFGFKSDLQLKILQDMADECKEGHIKEYFKERLLTLKINLGV